MFAKSRALFLLLAASSQAAIIVLRNDAEVDIKVHFNNTLSFDLEANETVRYDVDDHFESDFWAIAVDDKEEDLPKTIVHLALQETMHDNNVPSDYYGISLVSGYNLGAIIQPLDKILCPIASCKIDLASCPSEFQVLDDSGAVEACEGGASELFHSECPDAVVAMCGPLLTCTSSGYLVAFT